MRNASGSAQTKQANLLKHPAAQHNPPLPGGEGLGVGGSKSAHLHKPVRPGPIVQIACAKEWSRIKSGTLRRGPDPRLLNHHGPITVRAIPLNQFANMPPQPLAPANKIPTLETAIELRKAPHGQLDR